MGWADLFKFKHTIFKEDYLSPLNPTVFIFYRFVANLKGIGNRFLKKCVLEAYIQILPCIFGAAKDSNAL